MQYRQLGRTGARISEIVLGAATFGELIDESAVRNLVDCAVDNGVNAIDTGDIYAQGRSEQLVGRAVARHRDRVLVSTKVGFRVGDAVTQHTPAGTAPPTAFDRWRQGVSPNDDGLSRLHIRAALEASLRRLGLDHIDLYQVHRWDPRTPIEETLTALSELVRAGKVRYIGCSEFAGWQLVKALWTGDRLGIENFATMQVAFNLIARGPEQEQIPACVDGGVGVLAYQPLAGGMLTGRYSYDRGPEQGSRMAARPMYRERYWNPEVFDLVDRLRAVAEASGRTLPELAIGWLLANPSVNAVLVGAETPAEFEQNLTVTRRPLEADELAAIAGALKLDGKDRTH
ncbi:aldo/keto reductase [Actinomadura physcomitrii]|uniref:aldo/keto reductase n=1 Tax=Actinomadura physcomitrii TaxID=2650748 RepID=UPI0013706122|nr:aldo/keto reductase [Actinomadura physcomitrii]